MTEDPQTRYRRHRFPAEIIAHAVWLYYRFPLSLRDVEYHRSMIRTHGPICGDRWT
jgi:putative transposase